ncbi:MAG: hypothetical protein F9K25_10145 [Candidatus Contendobacter sp.]|nr:MAG: hypothetical protein F9K25_10145 [Candidatus Contendobacter sp.]
MISYARYQAILAQSDAATRQAAERAFAALLGKIRAGAKPRAALDAVLKEFNADAIAGFREALNSILQSSLGVAEVKAYRVGRVKLADALYANAKAVAGISEQIIERHLQGVHNARELRKALYEGYNFQDDPLDIIKPLPKYLQVEFDRFKSAALKTPALRAAYLDAIRKKEAGAGMEALEKALKVAFYERNRYYANRIARTELHRNYTDQVARELMEEEQIEYVQIRMSSKHPKTDICDRHAKLDAYGLGPGVYPKADAPKPPFHPHCYCVVSPKIDIFDAKPRFNPKAERAFLAKLAPKEARDIAGSWEKLALAKKGETLEAIYNAGKDPLYRWKRLGEVGQDARMSNGDNDFLEGRSRARGEQPKQAKPAAPGTITLDQLSKLEGDAKAYVLKNGQKTGNEHMAAIDLQTGKRLAQGTSNEPGRVYIPAELTQMADDPTRKIAYHHNHPDSYSLSPGDLAVMGKRPGLFQILVYGHDGSWFRAERHDFREFEMVLDAAKHEIWQQTGLARRRGLFLESLEAHLINLALARAGVIDYQFQLDEDRQRFYANERTALENMVDAAVLKIKRIRGF